MTQVDDIKPIFRILLHIQSVRKKLLLQTIENKRKQKENVALFSGHPVHHSGFN